MLQVILKRASLSINSSVRNAFSSNKQSSYAKMAAFRNEFDDKIKQKYVNNKTKDERFSQMDPEYIKKAITEEYEDAKQDLFQNGGILTELRESMLGKEEEPEENLAPNTFEDPVDNYLHDGLSHDEFLYRATNLKQQLFAKQIPDFFEKDEINSQYGNYSSFDRNFAKLRSMKGSLTDIGQPGYAGYKIEKWVNNIEGQTASRNDSEGESEGDEEVNSISEILNDQGLDLPEEEQLMLKWKLRDIQQQENDEYVPYIEELEGENQTNPFDNEDEDDGRLSCQARDDIYDLYQKGWSIKDICTRYGIIPERAKAVIWMCEKYYLQILPRADPLAIHLANSLEEEWEEENGWMDYGIDLEDLTERERGLHTISFNKHKEVDVSKQTENVHDIRDFSIITKRNTPKYEKLTLKLDGGLYQRGYLIKDWKINKGRGRRAVSKTFKRIVENSHNPSSLPLDAQLRVQEGPRIASRGYGSKQ